MTTEESAKRRAWATIHFGDKDLTEAELATATYMPSENFSDGWDKGAEWALTSLWKHPKDELPEKGEWVEVCLCRYDNSIKYRWEACYNGDGTFTDEDGITSDCFSYWARVPEPPKLNPEKEER